MLPSEVHGKLAPVIRSFQQQADNTIQKAGITDPQVVYDWAQGDAMASKMLKDAMRAQALSRSPQLRRPQRY